MSASLQLGFSARAFERVVADVAIAGFFASERPLRGAAGRADWRLCGQISQLLDAGRLRDRKHASVLVPAYGRMAARRVMLVGLGRRSAFGGARVSEAVASAVRRALGLGARRIALAPPSLEEGLVRHADALLRGAWLAFQEAELAETVELEWVVEASEEGPLRRAFEDSLEAAPMAEIRLRTEGPLHADGTTRGVRPTPLGVPRA